MKILINATQAAILGLLHDGPKTGGQVNAIAEKFLSPYWNMTRSQIYREMPWMAERGWLKAGKIGSRLAQPYKITSAGKQVFQGWLNESPAPDLLRSESALRIAFGSLQEPERVEKMMADLIERHHESLNKIEKLLTETIADGLEYDHEALRFAAAYHQMCFRWLSSVEMPE